MKGLVYIFGCLAVYGAIIGKLGAALIALMFMGIIIFAMRKFRQDDAAWHNDPAHATHLGCSTSSALDDHECECSRPQF